jgi:AcrR family transcriptional regulator
MARTKDPTRRDAILRCAKQLFAQKGYAQSSIADLVEASGFPVGSLYTYFSGKEDIARAIIEDGWRELAGGMRRGMASLKSPESRMSYLIGDFLPKLLDDADFISIVMSEAGAFANTGDKVEELSALLVGLFGETSGQHGLLSDYPPKSLKAGLAVFYLGILSVVKLSRSGQLDVGSADVLDFLKRLVEKSLNMQIGTES